MYHGTYMYVENPAIEYYMTKMYERKALQSHAREGTLDIPHYGSPDMCGGALMCKPAFYSVPVHVADA